MFARTSFIAFTVAAAISACQGYAVLSARAFPANCARNYTVSSGDTCDKISAAQSVSTFQLAKVNEGVIDPDCDNLFVGETICLGITGQDCTATHEVVTGDNCFGIAQSAGISESVLLENNPNVDASCDNIYPDEVLCTDPNVISYTS